MFDEYCTMTETEKQFIESLGKRVRDLRLKAGYTSHENFAFDAEITRSLYGRHEKGANMTVLSLLKIVQYHGMTLEEFFGEGFEMLSEKQGE